MMINIYGRWVNPNNITHILDNAVGCVVCFNGQNIDIRGKTAEEVSKELLRQTVIDSVELASKPISLVPKKKK